MAKRNYDLDDVIDNLNEQENRRSSSNQSTARGKVQIGVVEKYYQKLGVAAIKLTDSLSVGDVIEIGDEESAIRQKVESMQINRSNIDSAKAGDSVGILVRCSVKEGEGVYKF